MCIMASQEQAGPVGIEAWLCGLRWPRKPLAPELDFCGVRHWRSGEHRLLRGHSVHKAKPKYLVLTEVCSPWPPGRGPVSCGFCGDKEGGLSTMASGQRCEDDHDRCDECGGHCRTPREHGAGLLSVEEWDGDAAGGVRDHAGQLYMAMDC